jgi:hypothetical protein
LRHSCSKNNRDERENGEDCKLHVDGVRFLLLEFRDFVVCWGGGTRGASAALSLRRSQELVKSAESRMFTCTASLRLR